MAADRRSHRRRGQQGETLLESLVAIAILSLVAVAAYAGLRTAMASSAQHHASAVSETLLRTAAERLQDPSSPYIDLAGCGGHPTYADLPTRPGYAAIQVDVEFWTPPAGTVPSTVPMTFGSCPGSDPGLQLVQLSVTTPSGTTETLDVLKGQN